VRVNERIRVREIRVIDDTGQQLGIMPPPQALAIAKQKGLDLVEISPTANPPVCRIMDFGKYQYQEQKRAREARRHQKVIEVKEIKFRPKVDEHDYQFKKKHIERFLEEGDKVKATIFFRGREMAHPEIGRRIRADQPTTEWDIAQFMLDRYKDEGMLQEPMIVAVNANTADPHYMPTKEKNSPIKRGDFVLIDAATKLNKPDAVATDQTWTGYVGETVPEEYTRIFNIVREARDSAVDFIRNNVRAGKAIRGAEVDDVSRGVITRAGFGEQFTHRTGHSIGEETHGNGVNIDDFETRDSRRITPGVCFSIEPGIYQEGKFGVRSEINVYVSDKDIEVTGQPIQTKIIAILSDRKSLL